MSRAPTATRGQPRPSLITPLRQRDFRVMWAGMTVSLLGDGIFLVAMAWQVYALSSHPAALSLVGIALTLPHVALLLIGGAITDRFDRRLVMLFSDAIRGAAVTVIAVLSISGNLTLAEMVALVGLYGAGMAFHGPAFDAIVPDLVSADQLLQANSLDQVIRPLMWRLAGPALGGAITAAAGVGWAFAADALSFAASAAALLSMRARPQRRPTEGSTSIGEIREGFAYVRKHVWIWGTLVSAGIAYLLFMGPVEILLPYLVKYRLHAGAGALGLILALGGAGAITTAALVSRRELPRRAITLMYLAWTASTLAVAGYGIAVATWQLAAVSLAFNALEAVGLIVWGTLKQRHVPGALLGRVSSLQWMTVTGLLPLSFALAGPLSGAIGVRATFLLAGIAGAVVTFAALFLRGMRDLELPVAGASS